MQLDNTICEDLAILRFSLPEEEGEENLGSAERTPLDGREPHVIPHSSAVE